MYDTFEFSATDVYAEWRQSRGKHHTFVLWFGHRSYDMTVPKSWSVSYCNPGLTWNHESIPKNWAVICCGP